MFTIFFSTCAFSFTNWQLLEPSSKLNARLFSLFLFTLSLSHLIHAQGSNPHVYAVTLCIYLHL